MKTILSWLGDPFLHVIGIAVILLVIGSRMTSESNNDDSTVVTRCEVCHKVHDMSKTCGNYVARQTVSVRR